MPTISIIVAVYNVEKYLHRCIDSILAQIFTDFELILVDDGSTDDSGGICDDYAIKDNRIKVIHKENGGPSEARNVGIDFATGDYIGFVDSDDYIENDMYEKLHDACKKYTTQISMCGRYDVNGDEKKPLFTFEGYKLWSSKEAIKNLLTWTNIDSSPCDKLFEKILFSNIRFPVGKTVEDIFIIYQLLYRANNLSHIGEAKYYYCHRVDSRSLEEFSEKRLEILDASIEILDFINTTYPELKAEAQSFYYKSIIYLLSLLQLNNKKIQYQNSYNKLRKLLLENLSDILLSNYIDRKRKIMSIMMATNTYSFGKIVKRFVKFMMLWGSVNSFVF